MDSNPNNILEQCLDALTRPFCIASTTTGYANIPAGDVRIEQDHLTYDDAEEIMSGPLFFFQTLDHPHREYYIAKRDNIRAKYNPPE